MDLIETAISIKKHRPDLEIKTITKGIRKKARQYPTKTDSWWLKEAHNCALLNKPLPWEKGYKYPAILKKSE